MTSDNLERVALEACPLCGAGPARPMTATLAGFSGVEIIGTCHEGWPAVWCGSCGLTTRACETEAEAVEAWNTRPEAALSAIPVPSPMGEEIQGVTGACLSAPGSTRSAPEAPAGLRPAGDDPSRFTLTGAVSFRGSKRGERYFDMEIATPYFHSVIITVYGDEGREGDDNLTEDVAAFDGSVVTAACTVDRWHDLVTTPSQMLICDSDGSPQGRDAQRLDGEAATARADRHRPETPVRKGVA